MQSTSQRLQTSGEIKKGILFGVTSGLVAITCCVSPVVLALLGIATAAEAVSLGDTLYYTYGWFFRAAGIAAAVIIFLRRRRECSLQGASRYRRMIAVLAVSGIATYAALFWFTKYLGIWFG